LETVIFVHSTGFKVPFSDVNAVTEFSIVETSLYERG